MLNSGKTLAVAFVWHMHQPFYKDPISGSYRMPWTRLHGIKDYLPMALHVDRCRSPMRVTFNLVPSLVEQINDYVNNGATDRFLELTEKKAKDLDFAEKVEILNGFFRVNFNRFIAPSARYAELLIKKGMKPLSGAALKRVVGSFSAADFLDLQVLFSLAWTHSINIEEDPNLKAISEKGRHYTEPDKSYLLARQKEMMARILPLYRRLQDEGRIEITTTPFYHPILPLICDTNAAKVSMPRANLPKRRFVHPEDASWHIAEAIDYHASQFGSPPRGMWPSEGSVSDEALDMMISKGIDWVATDEDILFNSLSSYDRQYKGNRDFDRRVIYRPYRYKRDSREIAMIFRDKNLSDLISFSYNSWNPADAARDLMGHIKRVAENLRRDTDRGLLTIVMDGENAWEYFEDNGRVFFETLYAEVDALDDVSSATVSGFLELEKPKRSISRVFAGSWINHDFGIWIGDEQDNLSWDYLGAVRRDLSSFTKELHEGAGPSAEALRRAWRQLYIAEGSDWNWWYSGRAHAGGHSDFDELYRAHLKSIYKLLKKEVPDFLKVSIN